MHRYTHLLYGSSDSYDLKCRDDCELDTDCVDCPAFEFAVDQLGKYEEIGLTPEEIEDMATDWVVLKQLAEERKWISVNDRLPNVGEVVLAFGTRSAATGQFQGVTTAPSNWWWKGHTIKRVSHWMPLPEQPEE